MSNYSHALQSVLEEGFDGKQMRLAEKCDVPQSLISRHLTGNFRPDLDSLEKICATLGPDLRAKLAVAHLHDETPASARFYVRVQPASDSTAEVIHEMPPAFARLDHKTRRALEFIAQTAMDSKDACEAIQSTARFLGADLSKEVVVVPEPATVPAGKETKTRSKKARYEV